MPKVTLVTESPEQTGQVLQLADLFREFARKGGLQDVIPDPMQWQREQREERALPGRE